MQIIIILLIGQYLTFYSKYNVADANPLMGSRVMQAQPDELSFVVCIIKYNQQSFILDRDVVCTGTLISTDDVVTSEHCLESIGEIPFRVIIGSVNVRQGRAYFPAWWISYDQWAVQNNVALEFQQNDIALIRITEYPPDEVVPARLCNLNIDRVVNENVTLAGWGELGNQNTTPSILHKANVKILNMRECENRISRIIGFRVTIDRIYLCSSADPALFLKHGDSGGPVLLNNEIVGISKGVCPRRDLYANTDRINIHLSIFYYNSFILHALNFL